MFYQSKGVKLWGGVVCLHHKLHVCSKVCNVCPIHKLNPNQSGVKVFSIMDTWGTGFSLLFPKWGWQTKASGATYVCPVPNKLGRLLQKGMLGKVWANFPSKGGITGRHQIGRCVSVPPNWVLRGGLSRQAGRQGFHRSLSQAG